MSDVATNRSRQARRLQWLTVLLAAALGLGCASNSRSAPVPPDGPAQDTALSVDEAASATPDEVRPTAATGALADGPVRGRQGAGRNGTGEGQAFDPWEPFNRQVHVFNLEVDRLVARPLATAYRAVTPTPVRKGVGNFFSNLYQPVTAVHLMLQGRPVKSGSALLRFTMNATLGLGGFLDPATEIGLRQYSGDFGQTLGKWGWTESRYLVLPLLGSSTLRDGFGRLGDAPLNPIRQVNPERDRFLIQGVGLVDFRATLLELGELEADAGDSYTLFRDTYLQRRRFLITSDEEQLPDYLLDDDFDDIDFD